MPTSDDATLSRAARPGLARMARDAGFAASSGLTIFAASAALDAWPLAFVALAPLYLAVREAPPGRALAMGWLGGMVANLLGYAWGVGLLQRFGGMSLAASVASVVLVCAYQAMVLSLWGGASSLLVRRGGLSWLVAGPLCLPVAELLPMLFPWQLGHVAWRAWPVLQVAEAGGAGAVSAWLALLSLLLAESGLAVARRRRPGRPVRFAALLALAILAVGLLRAGHVAWARRYAPRLPVGIVQPNFGIMSVEQRKRHGQPYVEALRKATAEAGERGAKLVLWPESMFPFLFDRQLQREYAPGHPYELRGPYKGRLLMGALTHLFGTSYVYNSAVLISPGGAIAGTYDKSILLTFGEYIPLSDRYPVWAARIRQRLPDWPDIEPAGEPRLLCDGELRAGVFICYEDVVPGYVHRVARLGPNLLVTLANHAWFGDSSAPRQALAQATLRSVETRRDLVRATNTGVSSIGDALGRVIAEGPLLRVDEPGQATVLVGDVALLETFALGPYCAPYFPYACTLALAAATLRAWLRRRFA